MIIYNLLTNLVKLNIVVLTGKALKLELHTHLRQCQSILTKPLVGQKMADGLAREYYQHGLKSGFEWQVNFRYMTLLWRDHYQPFNIPVLNRCFFAGPNVYLRWSQSLQRSFVIEDLHGFLPSGLLCLCCAKRRHEDQRRRGTPAIFVARERSWWKMTVCVCVCLTGCSATLHGEMCNVYTFFKLV